MARISKDPSWIHSELLRQNQKDKSLFFPQNNEFQFSLSFIMASKYHITKRAGPYQL